MLTLFGDDEPTENRGAKKGEARAGHFYVEKKATPEQGRQAFETICGLMSERLDRLILDSKALTVRYKLNDGQLTLLLQDLQLLFFPHLYGDLGPGIDGNPVEIPVHPEHDEGLVPVPGAKGVGDDRVVSALPEFEQEYQDEEEFRRALAKRMMWRRITRRGGTGEFEG